MAPLLHAQRRAGLGAAGRHPTGVAATTGPSVDVSSTASVAAPTGRVPDLRGAFIIASTPCSCVGIGDQHSGIVRLFEVVYRQCSLPSLLTYLVRGYLGKSGAWVAGYTPLAGSGKKTRTGRIVAATPIVRVTLDHVLKSHDRDVASIYARHSRVPRSATHRNTPGTTRGTHSRVPRSATQKYPTNAHTKGGMCARSSKPSTGRWAQQEVPTDPQLHWVGAGRDAVGLEL